MTTMTMVRIYLTEAEKRLEEVMRYLHDEARVKGVTVFRGIQGFGASGEIHSAHLLDLSLDLPLVVEFFDDSARIELVTIELKKIVAPGHIIAWPITLIE